MPQMSPMSWMLLVTLPPFIITTMITENKLSISNKKMESIKINKTNKKWLW